jgi:hypothetical protein
VIIFFDEIDFFRTMAFDSSDFFAAIRAIHNDRANNPALQMLNFCFSGVVAPSNLISDPERTPFNIGKLIMLHDFSRAELEVFADGLKHISERPDLILDHIHEWTSGHPFLTHKLCSDISQKQQSTLDDFQLINSLIDKINIDNHALTDTQERFERSSNKHQLLSLYKKVFNKKEIPSNFNDPSHIELWLTGMISLHRENQRRNIRVRNKIFARTFNDEWIKFKEIEIPFEVAYKKWEDSNRHPDYVLFGKQLDEASEWVKKTKTKVTQEVKDFILMGLEISLSKSEVRKKFFIKLSVVIFLVLVIVGFLSIFVIRQQTEIAKQQTKIAKLAKQGEFDAKQIAELAKQTEFDAKLRSLEINLGAYAAELQRLLAIRNQKEAERQKDIANRQKNIAQQQTKIAQQQTKIAQQQTKRAETEKRRANSALKATQEGYKASMYAHKQGKSIDAMIRGIKAITPSILAKTVSPQQVRDGLFAAFQSLMNESSIRENKPPDHALARFPLNKDVSKAWLNPNGSFVTISYNNTMEFQRSLFGKHKSPRRVNLPQYFIRGLAMSDSHDLFTFTTRYNELHLFNNAQARSVGQLELQIISPNIAVFSRNNKKMAIYRGGSASEIEILYIPKLNRSQHLSLPNTIVHTLALSHNGRYLILGGFCGIKKKGITQVWDINSLIKPIKQYPHNTDVISVALSPDDRYIISISEDGAGNLFDFRQQRSLYIMQSPQANIKMTSGKFSSDGERIITTNADHSISLWDRATGKLLINYRGHDQMILDAQFTAHNQCVISASKDGQIRIFPASERAVFTFACSLLKQHKLEQQVREQCKDISILRTTTQRMDICLVRRSSSF